MSTFGLTEPEKKAQKLVWAGLALIFFVFFGLITWELNEDLAIDLLDRRILAFLSDHRIPAFSEVAADMTALGSPTVLTLFTMIGVATLILIRDLKGSAYLALGSFGAGVFVFLGKHIFTRARPSLGIGLIKLNGFSYPSGHSLGATTFYLIIASLAWRSFSSWQARSVTLFFTVFLILGVCFSRIYLGVHYPSDVLGGILFGSAWVCSLNFFFLHTGGS